jgi:hypothetical protein
LESRKWVLYSTGSYSTNHAPIGAHVEKATVLWETPLTCEAPRNPLVRPAFPTSHYDEWFEPLPHSLGELPCPAEELTVDLMGERPMDGVKTRWLISQRSCHKPVEVFAARVLPLEENIRLGLRPKPGESLLTLGETRDFEKKAPSLELLWAGITPRAFQRPFYEGLAVGREQVMSEKAYRFGSRVIRLAHALTRPFRRGGS